MSPCGQVTYCDFQDDFMVFLIQILDIFVKFTMNYFIFSFAFVTWDSSVNFCLLLFSCFYEDYRLLHIGFITQCFAKIPYYFSALFNSLF